MNTLPIGSISSGTMLYEDLVPAFMHVLSQVDAKKSSSIRREYSKVFRKLNGVNVRNYSDHEYQEDLSYLANEVLFDALNDYCPEFCYFGSSEGDGSDFGVWVDEYAVDNAIIEGKIYRFTDLADIDKMLTCYDEVPKTVLLVNEHGNRSLYHVTLEVTEHDNTNAVEIIVKEVWAEI